MSERTPRIARYARVMLVGFSLAVVAPRAPGADPAAAVPSGEPLTRVLDSITPGEMQELVDFYASDEMNGRYYRSEDGHRAARAIAGHFREAKLEPLGTDGFFQPIDVEGASPNVVGVRRGAGDRFVLVTAHYDHLKPATKGEDRIFNGADDNAAGVAALVEIARALASVETRLPHSIVLVAFTGEEYRMAGSRYYVEHPPLPHAGMLAILNLDMIARGEPDLLFIEGGRIFPDLAAAVARANEHPSVALDLRYDEHPRWLYMSDQMPFVTKGLPSLYFGVDFHPDTHRVTDEAHKILPGLAARSARLALAAAFELMRLAEGGAPGEGASDCEIPPRTAPREGGR